MELPTHPFQAKGFYSTNGYVRLRNHGFQRLRAVFDSHQNASNYDDFSERGGERERDFLRKTMILNCVCGARIGQTYRNEHEDCPP